jgi:hypothetical protein
MSSSEPSRLRKGLGHPPIDGLVPINLALRGSQFSITFFGSSGLVQHLKVRTCLFPLRPFPRSAPASSTSRDSLVRSIDDLKVQQFTPITEAGFMVLADQNRCREKDRLQRNHRNMRGRGSKCFIPITGWLGSANQATRTQTKSCSPTVRVIVRWIGRLLSLAMRVALTATASPMSSPNRNLG